MNPSLGLVMIVKDEAPVIARALHSVLAIGLDHWTIADTGSTDDTPAIVQRVLGHLPGTLVHRPWVNFGHNRTEVLQLARGTADVLLTLDADGTVFGSIEELAPVVREFDAWTARMEFRGLEYDKIRLFRGDAPWAWEGPVHETPVLRRAKLGQCHGIRTVYHTDGARSRDPNKFVLDAELLEAELRKRPDHPRTLYYCAQSWRDVGDLERAAELYLRRAALVGTWAEEQWSAMLEAAKCFERLGRSIEAVTAAYITAHYMRPARAESDYHLARYLWNHCRPALDSVPVKYHAERAALFHCERATETPRPPDKLFVEAVYGADGAAAKLLAQIRERLDTNSTPPVECGDE